MKERYKWSIQYGYLHTCHMSRIVRAVLDFDTLSRHPGKYEIVPEIRKIKSTNFSRPIKGEGFVMNSCPNIKLRADN